VAQPTVLQYNEDMDAYVPRYHRVYLVDDHDIVRRGLRDLLVDATDIDVVGDSSSTVEAVSEILRLDADVMLLDLQLQDGSGIQVCRAVRSVRPSVSGLLLTASGDDEALSAAVLAGAAGYLVKLSRNTDIVGAIRRLRPGASLLDQDMVLRARQVLDSAIAALSPSVTEHERHVLHQIVQGMTNSQIADTLAGTDDLHETDIDGLIARVTQTLLGPGAPPVQPGAGRHRRVD
jgi:two-component system response regulator DevR